jgi:hypothetical protein
LEKQPREMNHEVDCPAPLSAGRRMTAALWANGTSFEVAANYAMEEKTKPSDA